MRALDSLAITGYFNASAVTIETKGFLRRKEEQVFNELGEPSVTALIVENKTKQKVEYIGRNDDSWCDNPRQTILALQVGQCSVGKIRKFR